MKNVLLLGGAGYIGSVASKYLCEKKIKVTVVDNLLFNQKKNNYNKLFKNYKFINLNINNIKKSLFDNFDNVIILSSVVGDPITKKYPDISKKINLKYTKKIINILFEKKYKKIIFVSTCSNYGYLKNKIANEKTKLSPKSLYAHTKVEIEKYIIKKAKKYNKSEVTILRFATAFGISDRMRFDLTINQFVRDIYINKFIDVFDPYTWRPYCHVLDFAKIFYMLLVKNNIKRKNIEIFNVGNSSNNFNKFMIIKKIKKYIKNFKIILKPNSVDPRDYKVNFSKIKKIYNFQPKMSVEKGIKEILDKLKNKNFISIKKYKDKLGNYKINKNV